MAFCDVVGAPQAKPSAGRLAPLLRHLAPAPSHARQQTPEPSRSKSGCCFVTEMLRTQLLGFSRRRAGCDLFPCELEGDFTANRFSGGIQWHRYRENSAASIE